MAIQSDEFSPTIAPGTGKTKLYTAGSATSGVVLDHSTADSLTVADHTGAANAPVVAASIAVGGPAVTVVQVNSVSPTSPNRTIQVTVGGTTYYIAAKTTND